MRNILLFPNGTKKDFMYPENREVVVGETFQVEMKDDSIHVMKIDRIEQLEKEIIYHLSIS
jgi:hypothetical protein